MPDSEPPLIRAEDLVAQMEDAAGDALRQIGETLKAMVIADLPQGDESLDPDPAYSLRDHIVVRRYGNTVSVSVEGKYAVAQHESQQFKHPRGGRAKFLERNATALVATMQTRLAGEIAQAFSRPRRDRRNGGVRARVHDAGP